MFLENPPRHREGLLQDRRCTDLSRPSFSTTAIFPTDDHLPCWRSIFTKELKAPREASFLSLGEQKKATKNEAKNWNSYMVWHLHFGKKRWEEKISRPISDSWTPWDLWDHLGFFAVPALWKDQQQIKSHIWNKLRKAWHGNHASLCILYLSHTLPSVLGHTCTKKIYARQSQHHFSEMRWNESVSMMRGSWVCKTEGRTSFSHSHWKVGVFQDKSPIGFRSAPPTWRKSLVARWFPTSALSKLLCYM